MGRVVEREWGGAGGDNGEGGGERIGMVVEREWGGWWRENVERMVERD